MIPSGAYTLDDVGNRTQRVDQQGTHTYQYDDLYRLTSVTYPGPTMTSYAFDAFGKPHEPDGRRDATTYAYDDNDPITSVTPPIPASVINYSWDDNGDLATSGSVANEFDFAGQQTDPTGLQYLRARYYDPETGTFLSRDPLSSKTGWSQSPFGYADPAPSNFGDPWGLDKCSWKDPWECVKNAGSAIGGAAGGTASAAVDQLQDATDALVDLAIGKAKDPLVQLSIAQAAAGLAAALACPAAVVSGGAAAPACAGAVALVGYTISAKQEIIKKRREEGVYNEAQFVCMLITSAPVPVPGVIPGISMPLYPAVGKLQDVVEEALGGGQDTPSPLKEKP